jgi:hypothetical protein
MTAHLDEIRRTSRELVAAAIVLAIIRTHWGGSG